LSDLFSWLEKSVIAVLDTITSDEVSFGRSLDTSLGVEERPATHLLARSMADTPTGTVTKDEMKLASEQWKR